MQTKQERLDNIEMQIDELYKERNKLVQQIAQDASAKHIARVKSWNLTNDSCLLLFSKRPNGYHWWIAKTIRVKEIDFDHEYIDSIEAKYGESDYQYYVKVEESSIPFSSLEEIENEFNIYFVDEVQLTLLQHHFCNLSIDYKNYHEYEEAFAKNASLSIKIPV